MTFKLLVRTVDSKSYVHQAAIPHIAEPEKMLGTQTQLISEQAPMHRVIYKFADSVAKCLEKGENPKFFYIYCLIYRGEIFYVGYSVDVKERVYSHSYDAKKTKLQRPSAVGTQEYIKNILKDGDVEIEVVILEEISAPEGFKRGDKTPKNVLELEQFHISECRKLGYPLVNKDKTEKASKVKTPKEIVPKIEKVKALQGEGKGGWAVHPNNYGTGKILRSYFDGVWWTAKHDDIFDAVNTSLAKGGKKTLIENPRPFSSGTGLRGGDKYWTKE